MEKYNKKRKKKLGRERRAGFGLGGVVCVCGLRLKVQEGSFDISKILYISDLILVVISFTKKNIITHTKTMLLYLIFLVVCAHTNQSNSTTVRRSIGYVAPCMYHFYLTFLYTFFSNCYNDIFQDYLTFHDFMKKLIFI